MSRIPDKSVRPIGKSSSALSRLRIVFLGYLIRGPVGGMAWNRIQYLVGLSNLGHDIYYIEDSDDFPSCYDPVRDVTDSNPSYGLEFINRTFQRLGLSDRWAYYDAHTSSWIGPCANRIVEICSTADLLIHHGGVNRLRPLLMNIPERAMVDLDPVFTQIRHLTEPNARSEALKHTVFFSVGENIGKGMCTVPDDGFPWKATHHPIVLQGIPLTPAPKGGKFTTVMLWDSYSAVDYDGVRYGMKSDSFWTYMNLPERAGHIFELAMGSPSRPEILLRSKGWTLRDPLEITRDPWAYQIYIQQSKAEFSVAKHGYVVSQSGWFSDRSILYLASGRPVLIQDTGFPDWLESGLGVISFKTLDEAVAGIEDINSRYEFHCEAARQIAVEYFDADKVLPSLIERAMNNNCAY
jgi:hypothetical protein